MNKRPRKIFVFIIARTSNPLDNFEAKICVMLIVMIIKIKNDSREKNPNEFILGIQERLEIHISSKNETIREFNFTPILMTPRNPPLFPLL